MSLGEFYKDLREYRKEKKEDRYNFNVEFLHNHKIPYKKLSAYHFRILDQIDFWPSTGKFHVLRTGKRGHGTLSFNREYRKIKSES